MRIWFFSRKTLIFASILLVAAAVACALHVLGHSESVAAWVQAGVGVQ